MNKFLKEIFEQPGALEETLNYYLHGKGQGELGKVAQIWRKGRFKSVLFTGMGSSYFAPYTASCILSNNRISSCNINAGELLHYHLPILKKEVLLTCISQSGESYEVVKVLEKVTSEITCIGITNEETSTLASKASVTLLSKAGREDMTSTKTYISTLLVLHIYSNVLSGKWNPCSMPEL